MVSPPSPAVEGQRVTPTPFLSKTYQLVDDPSIDSVISWNGDGSAFVVWSPGEFARDVLPKYFKHNNFSSFIRQLNTYGFRKTVPDRWEFTNDCFRRGEKGLLCDIQRRKIGPSPAAVSTNPVASPEDSGDLSSNSSPPQEAVADGGSAVDLSDDNNRLRRENAQISRELAIMKELYNTISRLMSRYAAGRGVSCECETEMETETKSVEPSQLQSHPPSLLELIPPVGRSRLAMDVNTALELELELKPEPEILQLISDYLPPAQPLTALDLTSPVAATEPGENKETLLFGARIGLKRKREEGPSPMAVKQKPENLSCPGIKGEELRPPAAEKLSFFSSLPHKENAGQIRRSSSF